MMGTQTAWTVSEEALPYAEVAKVAEQIVDSEIQTSTWEALPANASTTEEQDTGQVTFPQRDLDALAAAIKKFVPALRAAARVHSELEELPLTPAIEEYLETLKSNRARNARVRALLSPQNPVTPEFIRQLGALVEEFTHLIASAQFNLLQQIREYAVWRRIVFAIHGDDARPTIPSRFITESVEPPEPHLPRFTDEEARRLAILDAYAVSNHASSDST